MRSKIQINCKCFRQNSKIPLKLQQSIYVSIRSMPYTSSAYVMHLSKCFVKHSASKFARGFEKDFGFKGFSKNTWNIHQFAAYTLFKFFRSVRLGTFQFKPNWLRISNNNNNKNATFYSFCHCIQFVRFIATFAIQRILWNSLKQIY